MRSPRLILGLLCGAACVTAVAVYAGGPQHPSTPVASPCLPCCPVELTTACRAAPTEKAKVSTGEARQSIVEELTATLEETRSVDTYLLAVTALAELGPRARPAVRAIIRNGERLLVLKDHAAQASPCAERIRCAQQVHQAVIRILNAGHQGVYGPYAYSPYPGPFFVPPTPVYQAPPATSATPLPPPAPTPKPSPAAL